MSKAAPSAPEKSTSEYELQIKYVLEDVLPVNSDSTIKVKTFKKFLDYDLKTLNITGELQTNTHKNGFTHTKMVVTYQDKKTNKVNYLEIDVLDNTSKKVENAKKKVLLGCDQNCTNCNTEQSCCGSCPINCTGFCDNVQGCFYCLDSDSGVITVTTEGGTAAQKNTKLIFYEGQPVAVTVKGKNYSVYSKIAI